MNYKSNFYKACKNTHWQQQCLIFLLLIVGLVANVKAVTSDPLAEIAPLQDMIIEDGERGNIYDSLKLLDEVHDWSIIGSNDPVSYQVGTLITSLVFSPGTGLNLFFVTDSFEKAVAGNLATIPISTIALFNLLQQRNVKSIAEGFIKRDPTKIVISVVSFASGIIFIAADAETAYRAMGKIQCERESKNNYTLSFDDCEQKINNYTYSGCQSDDNEEDKCNFNSGFALLGGIWNGIPGGTLGYTFLLDFFAEKIDEFKEIGKIVGSTFSDQKYISNTEINLKKMSGMLANFNTGLTQKVREYHKLTNFDLYRLMDGVMTVSAARQFSGIALKWAAEGVAIGISITILNNVFNSGKTYDYLKEDGFSVYDNGLVSFPNNVTVDVTDPAFEVNSSLVEPYRDSIDGIQSKLIFYRYCYGFQGLAISYQGMIRPIQHVIDVAYYISRHLRGMQNIPVSPVRLAARVTGMGLSAVITYWYGEVILGSTPSIAKIGFFNKAVGDQSLLDEYISPETQARFSQGLLYSLWVNTGGDALTPIFESFLIVPIVKYGKWLLRKRVGR